MQANGLTVYRSQALSDRTLRDRDQRGNSKARLELT
jgi:hypothetical protein